MKSNNWLKTTGIFGTLAVAIGAFGAHGLSNKLSATQLHTFETGSEYHFYHTLALLGVALLMKQQHVHKKMLNRAGWAFTLGIILFSGSLYLLACKNILNIENFTSLIGPVTPLGGLCFIIGWIMLILSGNNDLN